MTIFEHTDQEIADAIKFVITDNPDREWTSEDEFISAVDKYLDESTVISNLEQLVKDGLVEEITPNHFVPTKKGLEIADQIKKEREGLKK